MTTFKDLKSQWENQPHPPIPHDGSEVILHKIADLKKKQIMVNIILGITASILVYYFFYIEAYKVWLVSLALGMMIGSLLIRILIEFFSIKKLKAIDVTSKTSVFNEKMIIYYKNRIKTHYVATPIILLLYSVGFIILLPFFKKHLSEGFYTYIIVSAIIILFVMVFFIRKQIIKELSILKEIRY